MAVQKLRIQEPNKAPREIDIAPGLTIGRAATNRCVLDDAAASSEHARIVELGGSLAIQDVGSANKTRVDGGPALTKDQHARLVPGMRLTIGGTKLEVLGDDEEDAGATMQRAKNTDQETDMRTMVRAKGPGVPAPKAAAGDDGGEATLVKRTPAPAPKVEAPLRPAQAPTPRAAPTSSGSTSSRPPSGSAGPVPAEAPVRSRASEGEDFGSDDAAMTAAVGSPEFEPALLQATLSEAKPRLVFRVKKQGFVLPVTEPMNVIGRKAVGDVTIALDDDGVSSRHARLTLSGRTFWIEDLASKNHTLLDKEQLAPKVKRALHGDCWLRFGTVDVLFVTEPVAGMESPDPAMYDEAIGFLEETGTLAGESLKQARTTHRAGKHPAQELINAGVVSVAQWHDAITTAKLRVRANVPGRRKGSKHGLLVIGLIVLVLILVVVVILMLKK